MCSQELDMTNANDEGRRAEVIEGFLCPAQTAARPSFVEAGRGATQKTGRGKAVGRLLLAVAAVWLIGASLPVCAHAAEALPSPLHIEDVRRLARERRSEIRAAQARVRAAAQRPAIVSALEDPVVSPSVDHLPFALEGADVSLAIEQRMPLSGILGHRRRAAEAEAERFPAEANRTALDVELDATAAFLMLHERRQMLRAIEAQLDLARQLVAAANARYAGGTGAQAEVLRAEVEAARLEGTLRSLGAETRAAEAMLNASLARDADAPVPALESRAQDAAPPPWLDVKAAAMEQRPELRAGRAEIDRARAEVKVMRSMYAPMAMVRGGPSYTMADGGGAMLMVGISIPIWRGRLRAGVAEAEAMVEMADADIEAMRRMIEGESAIARERVSAAREQFLALRDEIVPRAGMAIDPTLAAYSAGRVPLVSVIEAAQVLWAAQMELIGAEFALELAWARLRRASGDLGGGSR